MNFSRMPMWDNLLQQITLYGADFQVSTALLVFVAYVVADMLYARYTIAITKLHAARAATTGAVMYFLLAVGILSYTDNPLYLFPLVLGSWVGTYVTVEIERKKMLK